MLSLFPFNSALIHKLYYLHMSVLQTERCFAILVCQDVTKVTNMLQNLTTIYFVG